MSSEEVISDACAACGQGGDGLKKCTSCKQVKYCGRECQASHWKVHKRACKKMFDEALFRQPPRRDDCPICCLILPIGAESVHYTSCCSRAVCYGCMFMANIVEKSSVCPFCRQASRCEGGLTAGGKYLIEGYSKRAEANDAGAMTALGGAYYDGITTDRDLAKARGLWERAGKLGSAKANSSLAQLYSNGDGVARDLKKMEHYLELAAMGGEVNARYHLGRLEIESNNRPPGSGRRALKHFAIAAKDGHERAMEAVTHSAKAKIISSQEYEETLRAFVNVTKEMKSKQRDKAAAFSKAVDGDLGSEDPGDRESADRVREERGFQWLAANVDGYL